MPWKLEKKNQRLDYQSLKSNLKTHNHYKCVCQGRSSNKTLLCWVSKTCQRPNFKSSRSFMMVSDKVLKVFKIFALNFVFHKIKWRIVYQFLIIFRTIINATAPAYHMALVVLYEPSYGYHKYMAGAYIRRFTWPLANWVWPKDRI